MTSRAHYCLIIFLSFFIFISCGGNGEEIIESAENPDAVDTSSPTPSLVDEDKTVGEKVQSYDPPNRNIWQKPDFIIQMLGDLSDKTIADIGAGSGAFSRRLAQQAKKVIAIEIDENLLEYIDSVSQIELAPQFQKRLELRKAELDNSNLKKGEADIIVLMNTYLYMPDGFRVNYLKHLYSRLPSGGKLVIIDFKRKRIPIRTSAPRIPLFKVELEVESAGFDSFKSDDAALEYQYILTATKN